MFRIISVIIFKLKGWKLNINSNLISKNKRLVLIGVPHTSNWDAIYFTGATYLAKLKIHFMIKKEWMRFPFNFIFKPIGGLAVNNKNKNQPTNIINELTHLFQKKNNFIIAIAPEGTRSYNPHWKTGFYQIALKSNVPIALGFLDYKNKIAGITDVFIPTGDLHLDLLKISNYYKKFTGKNHSQFAPYQVK